LNLKFLNELAASNDRNFKFTALAAQVEVRCAVRAAADLRPQSAKGRQDDYHTADAFLGRRGAGQGGLWVDLTWRH
jgi:hypothetical protein